LRLASPPLAKGRDREGINGLNHTAIEENDDEEPAASRAYGPPRLRAGLFRYGRRSGRNGVWLAQAQPYQCDIEIALGVIQKGIGYRHHDEGQQGG